MKQSMGMTVTIGIIIIFIVLVFSFLAATLSYYKVYKVNNTIIESIEKYEGVNPLFMDDVSKKLSGIGYNGANISCKESYHYKGKTWYLVSSTMSQYVSKWGNIDVVNKADGDQGFCVYVIYYTYNKAAINSPYAGGGAKYIQYGVLTYMGIDIPTFDKFFRFPVFSASRKMYIY